MKFWGSSWARCWPPTCQKSTENQILGWLEFVPAKNQIFIHGHYFMWATPLLHFQNHCVTCMRCPVQVEVYHLWDNNTLFTVLHRHEVLQRRVNTCQGFNFRFLIVYIVIELSLESLENSCFGMGICPHFLYFIVFKQCLTSVGNMDSSGTKRGRFSFAKPWLYEREFHCKFLKACEMMLLKV